MSEQRYPLSWPPGRPRIKQNSRRDSQFGQVGGARGRKEPLTISQAITRLQDQLDLLGATDYVLSSNLNLRLDGVPMGGQGNPIDPGVALYFTLKGKPHCLPCDTFLKASDNIAAIAAHIEASRAIERYGVGDMAAIFAGFAALPPGAIVPPRPWRVVLGFAAGERATAATIEAAYRKLAGQRHPDKPGGSNDAMAELNAAREIAARECDP